MFQIKFVPKVYKFLPLAGLMILSFCGDSFSGPVVKIRILALLAVLVSSCFQIRFENGKSRWMEAAFAGAVSAVGAYACCQVFMDLPLMMPVPKMVGTVCFYFGVYAWLYMLTLNAKISALLPVTLAAVLSLVEIYVLAFRGTSFKLVDILAIQTAAQVAGEYRFFVNTPIISGMVYYLTCVVFLLFGISAPQKPKGKIAARVVPLLLSGALLVGAYTYGAGLERAEWLNDGVRNHGITLNLMCEFANGYQYVVPEGYDEFDIRELEEAYPPENAEDRKPHVIVVMNESYADLRVFNGGLSVSEDVLPFADALQENAVKGYALTSTLGGGTANSEYEFLTGHTMAFLPYGICPFQHYVPEGSYSLVNYMKALGYKAVGIHPEEPINWMRKTAWLNFGFDEVYFIEDFPREDMIRDKVSDMEYVEKLLKLFEESKKEQPMFLFGVTMQNHSPYNDASFTATHQLTEYSGEYPEAEQYLSVLRLSDAAMEVLVEELAKMEDEVVLLVYGDHQPSIEMAFLEELNGSPLYALEARQKQYTVPFYIWANYDIPEKTVELTSLNYLSSYLLECAGLPLPAYNRYLKDLEEGIPAVNVLGYWSRSSNGFIPRTEASGTEKKMLEEYASLQYHALFEKENRSQFFFPN